MVARLPRTGIGLLDADDRGSQGLLRGNERGPAAEKRLAPGQAGAWAREDPSPSALIKAERNGTRTTTPCPRGVAMIDCRGYRSMP